MIDQDDKRAGNAQVTVVVEGERALLVRTGNRTRADRVALIACAPVLVQSVDDVADVRVRVA